MDTREIRKMSRVERLAAMEALWDSLVEEESEIESPEWHREILEERRRKIESGKAECISLEKLRASDSTRGQHTQFHGEMGMLSPELQGIRTCL